MLTKVEIKAEITLMWRFKLCGGPFLPFEVSFALAFLPLLLQEIHDYVFCLLFVFHVSTVQRIVDQKLFSLEVSGHHEPVIAVGKNWEDHVLVDVEVEFSVVFEVVEATWIEVKIRFKFKSAGGISLRTHLVSVNVGNTQNEELICACRFVDFKLQQSQEMGNHKASEILIAGCQFLEVGFLNQ